METHPLSEAISICGTQEALAKKIGVTQQLVSYWLNKPARVPAEYALPIEAATGGKVSRSALRPDIYPPAIAAPDGASVAA